MDRKVDRILHSQITKQPVKAILNMRVIIISLIMASTNKGSALVPIISATKTASQ